MVADGGVAGLGVTVENTSDLQVHHRNRPGRDIHRRYGLCIMGGALARAPVDGFHATPQRRFEFYSLSHLVEGRGRLWLAPDREFDLFPGDAVLVCPGDLNRYGGYGGECYVEEVVTFYGPVADMLRAAGVLATGVCRMGAGRPLRPVIATAADPADAAQINANMALQQLLVELYNRRRAASDGDPFAELAETIRRAPERWWTVKEMAEACGVSENRLRRGFLRHTGLKPKEYVEEAKLRRAAELLIADGEATVAAVAARLGYYDEYHFSRRFKAFFKMPPGRYRAQFARGGGGG